MHSYNRTLLAKLGFADADKSDPRHDLACQYIGQPETVEKIAQLLGLSHEDRPFSARDRAEEWKGLVSVSLEQQSVTYESPVEKGSGQYKTTIGFIDVLLEFVFIRHERQVYHRRLRHSGEADAEWCQASGGRLQDAIAIGVEVKIAPVPIGSLIRQIKLYRSYAGPGSARYGGISRWLVATDYDMPQVDLMSLRNERIVHVRLGQCFEEFVRRCGAGSAGDQVEI